MGAKIPVLNGGAYQFYDDDAVPGSATELVARTTPLGIIATNTNFRLRVSINETGSANARNSAFQLAQRVNNGLWLVTGDVKPCVAGATSYIAPSAQDELDFPALDTATATQIITTGTFTPGYMLSTTITNNPSVTVSKNSSIEYEFCVILDNTNYVGKGGTDLYEEGDIIYLQLIYADGSSLDSYSNIPSLTVGPYTEPPLGYSNLSVGSSQVTNLHIGATPAQQVFVGSTQVFQA